MPRKIFFKPLNLIKTNQQDQVDNDGNPRGLAAAGTRQIVLQLNEQMRNAGIVLQFAVRGFPSLSVVEPELFRLRLLGRSHRILEWNLCNGA